jgi:uncharacterized protein
MSRSTLRVQFPGHAGNLLAGILEQPAQETKGLFLFSHCFTCNKDLKAIVRISRELADLGWSVLRYDFSGLGNSQGRFEATNFTTNQVDLRCAWTYLEADFGRPKFLVGHSFGGAASLSVAEELDVSGVITIAAPSDTHHLARLLVKMDPSIEMLGTGTVSIGGRSYTIDRQMIEDFLRHDLASTVRAMTKPLLALHSTVDETLAFDHAIRNCGFDSVPRPSNRSLVSIPGANHLLTNRPNDCTDIAQIIDTWCKCHAIDSTKLQPP